MAQAKVLTPEALIEMIFEQSERERKARGVPETDRSKAAFLAQAGYVAVNLARLDAGREVETARFLQAHRALDALRFDAAALEGPEQYMRLAVPVLAGLGDVMWTVRETQRCSTFDLQYGEALWYGGVIGYLGGKGLLGYPYYLRVSVDDPTLWAYTATPEHGIADRQTKVKLGKLLVKLLPDEKPVTIQRVATHFQSAGAMALQWATTEDEIERVYAQGPDSCMKGQSAVRAYAHPDVALAYITDLNGRITARTVCNMAKKQYARVYGNIAGIVPVLEQQGFVRGSLEGCRLKTIYVSNDNGIISVPWLDHPNAGEQEFTFPERDAEKYGDFIRGHTYFDWDQATETITVNIEGQHKADTQSERYDIINGCARDEDGDEDEDRDEDHEDESLCGECDEWYDPDFVRYVEFTGGDVCEACLDNHFSFGIVGRDGEQDYMRNSQCSTVTVLGDDSVVIADNIQLSEVGGYVWSGYHDDHILEGRAVWSKQQEDYLYMDDDEVDRDANDDWVVTSRCEKLHDGEWLDSDSDQLCVLSARSEKAGCYAMIGDEPHMAVDVAGPDDDEPIYVLNSEVPATAVNEDQRALAL